MARKSRKKTENEKMRNRAEILYHTAIYARLSIEDNGVQGDSIENQIEITERYIRDRPELKVVGRFVDNGETGTDFERPAFSDMMEAVKKGTIQCIVVKDLSRFGRNYLETGKYLEKIFPCLGIRFISVNDHFDSLHGGMGDTLLVPLKSILHDTYAKDISKKVSSAIDVKKKAGRFMGKIPPYGYVRDEQDRYRLRVHSERAEIVRMIFKWKKEGAGPVSIARRLNDMEVPTQLRIRYMEGHRDGKENALWRGSAVTDILKNPCYTGCMAERKGSSLLCEGRKDKSIPEAEWNLIENTHEPIIDRETFEEVRRLLAESKQKRERQIAGKSFRKRTENILRGMVECGICGGRVQRDSGYFRKDGSPARYSFYCPNKYIRTKGCSSGSVRESELHDCIFQVCRKQLELLDDMKKTAEDMIKEAENDPYIVGLKGKICIMENKRQKLRRKRNTLYADFKEGLITEAAYIMAMEKYRTDSERLNRRSQAARAELSEKRRAAETAIQRNDVRTRFWDARELTGEMCLVMVKKVVLHEDSVSIHFTFADMFEKVSAFLKGHMER